LNISKIGENRFRSDTVIVNGYEFQFFVKKNGKDIAGFLGCSSSLLPPAFFLPVCYTIEIKLASSSRKLPPNKVVFVSPEKAIGINLTLQDETVENNAIVVHDKLTVIVTVEFLDSGEGCALLASV